MIKQNYKISLESFYVRNPNTEDQLCVITSNNDIDDVCCFDVSRRTYTKSMILRRLHFKGKRSSCKFTPDQEI